MVRAARKRVRMKGALRSNDVLVVKSIDRFGRDYEEIIGQRHVTERSPAREHTGGKTLPRAARGGPAGIRKSAWPFGLLCPCPRIRKESDNRNFSSVQFLGARAG